jgi:mono/diheme cytochrome c family protein
MHGLEGTVIMSILLFKSILSMAMIFSALFAMFTMFEILARKEKKFSVERLKTLHKINGIVYFLIFLFISYFCLGFIITSKVELTPRGTLHSVLALTVLVLFGLKIAIIKIYRQYYLKVQTIGLLIALITFGMFGTSGGYYLLVANFGKDKKFDKIMEYKKRGMPKIEDKKDEDRKIVIATDPESIDSGKSLFEAKCSFCHNAYSTETIVGPGLTGVLKKSTLPVSGRPATPENIRQQLRQPFSEMPSFEYLSEEKVKDIIAFLNTL